MSELTEIAHLIDRPVWAVSGAIREQHQDLPVASALAADTFGPLINLLPFRNQLTEPLILRRYIYRDPDVMKSFADDLVGADLFERTGDNLSPTPTVKALAAEVSSAVDAVCLDLWGADRAVVDTVSEMARTVLDTATDRHGLVGLAQEIVEPDDALHRLWWRLTALRLVRNEAHVTAWTNVGLTASDVEVLTSAWAGTSLQSERSPSEELESRGWFLDGSVTEEGLHIRQLIEDGTDDVVREALTAVDSAAFLALLTELSPLEQP